MGVHFQAGMVEMITRLMGDMFVLMIKLAAPTFIALFLVTVALGIIARTVPQINVLLIGFPLKVSLGLIVTALALAGIAALLVDSFGWILRQVELMTQMMVAR
jgi:flagellar biosynthetic protein FliR